ncbi:VanZ family protein [Conexibacter sp. SYSU D00693]|uniref:VanZ family protein n=1 Tax=Conexibacter sp. SYSU D00693 TaxID=2812560 RepID=UPI00196A63B7|nr:VanZ family protein [Conexibacter sp. SYSU D00693]
MALVSRFAPPLALMGLIFYLSDQPDLSSGLGDWDLLLRKGAHMTEYALLWLLWLRALGWRAPVAAAVVAIAYAATDELHQSTVEGRHGTPVDVLIDAVGVALGWLAFRLRPAVLRRRRPRSTSAA